MKHKNGCTYDPDHMQKVIERTPLEPFDPIGAAYNCLKATLWIVYNSRLMCFGKVAGHLAAIAEILMDAEAEHAKTKERSDL